MGATIRIYAESFERDPERQNRETQVRRESNGVSAGPHLCVPHVRHTIRQSVCLCVNAPSSRVFYECLVGL